MTCHGLSLIAPHSSHIHRAGFLSGRDGRTTHHQSNIRRIEDYSKQINIALTSLLVLLLLVRLIPVAVRTGKDKQSSSNRRSGGQNFGEIPLQLCSHCDAQKCPLVSTADGRRAVTSSLGGGEL